MKKLVVSVIVVFLGIFAYLLSSGQRGSNLRKEGMKQIYAGWTCVNMRQCSTDPNDPGDLKHCAHKNNYLKCFGRDNYTPCKACDDNYGGNNEYCIGSIIGITCWEQKAICGWAFDGYCWYSNCIATGVEPIEPKESCGDWDQCKNE